MNCVICKHGVTSPGFATVTLERGDATLIFKSVPCDTCDNCGEEYVSDGTTKRLLKEAEGAVKSGVEFEVRAYPGKAA